VEAKQGEGNGKSPQNEGDFHGKSPENGCYFDGKSPISLYIRYIIITFVEKSDNYE